jgi:spore coat protein JB
MNKTELLKMITEVSFVMDELRLYLDTHPDCQKGLDYYEKQRKMRDDYIKEYTIKYGPLRFYDVTDRNKWTWVNDPWPWEAEANFSIGGANN